MDGDKKISNVVKDNERMRQEIEVLSDELERMRRVLLNEVGEYDDAIAEQMNESDDDESSEYEEEEGEEELSEMESDFDPVTQRQVHSDQGSEEGGVLGGNPLFGLASVPEDH